MQYVARYFAGAFAVLALAVIATPAEAQTTTDCYRIGPDSVRCREYRKPDLTIQPPPSSLPPMSGDYEPMPSPNIYRPRTIYEPPTTGRVDCYPVGATGTVRCREY